MKHIFYDRVGMDMGQNDESEPRYRSTSNAEASLDSLPNGKTDTPKELPDQAYDNAAYVLEEHEHDSGNQTETHQ